MVAQIIAPIKPISLMSVVFQQVQLHGLVTNSLLIQLFLIAYSNQSQFIILDLDCLSLFH